MYTKYYKPTLTKYQGKIDAVIAKGQELMVRVKAPAGCMTRAHTGTHTHTLLCTRTCTLRHARVCAHAYAADAHVARKP